MSRLTEAQLADLVQRARAVLPHAHAPYSDFRVAAAVLDEQGRIHLGVNVENASYGLTNCAERVAIGVAVAAGARRIRAVAVTAAKLHPIAPCGACRQVIREFGKEAAIIIANTDGTVFLRTTLADLLPHSFGPEQLEPPIK
jgi:cytidine deaminase